MKKLILITTISLFSIAVSAQRKNSFEIHAKGMVNSSWLFNNDISDLGPEEDYRNSFSFNYGLAFNAYFGNAGVGVEALYGNATGNYLGTYDIKDVATGSVVSTTNYKSAIDITTLQVPLMFKLKGEKAVYLEIGPQFNSVFSAKYTSETNGNSAVTTNVSNAYSNYYFSAVLGFGANIKLGESPIGIVFGMRLQYGFTDLKGVSGRGIELSNKTVFPNSAITSHAAAGLKLGVSYNFGEKK